MALSAAANSTALVDGARETRVIQQRGARSNSLHVFPSAANRLTRFNARRALRGAVTRGASNPVVMMTLAHPKKQETPDKLPPQGPNRLHELYEKGGQSPWIDNLTRDWVETGHLQELVKRGVRGLTSNPTIFEKSIGGGTAYDDQIRDLVKAKGVGHSTSADVSADAAAVEGMYWEIAKTDILTAAEAMHGLYMESQGGDGYVSLEVSPALAHDTQSTTDFARSLHLDLGLPNLMVKIPGTLEGLPAVKQMIAEGRSINVTLIFSLKRYADVIEAYISGLEQLAASSNADLSQVASVASFFISRVDAAVDARLDSIGTPEALALKGKAAVAQGVLAYNLFLEKFSGERWEKLAARGARPQRPLWASTGVKSKAYPDTLYVDELIGPNTVNTLPDATLLAFADHGKVSRTVDKDVDGARDVLRQIAALGIDMEEVAQDLEADGVRKFGASFDSLISTLQGKVAAVAKSTWN